MWHPGSFLHGLRVAFRSAWTALIIGHKAVAAERHAVQQQHTSCLQSKAVPSAAPVTTKCARRQVSRCKSAQRLVVTLVRVMCARHNAWGHQDGSGSIPKPHTVRHQCKPQATPCQARVVDRAPCVQPACGGHTTQLVVCAYPRQLVLHSTRRQWLWHSRGVCRSMIFPRLAGCEKYFFSQSLSSTHNKDHPA